MKSTGVGTSRSTQHMHAWGDTRRPKHSNVIQRRLLLRSSVKCHGCSHYAIKEKILVFSNSNRIRLYSLHMRSTHRGLCSKNLTLDGTSSSPKLSCLTISKRSRRRIPSTSTIWVETEHSLTEHCEYAIDYVSRGETVFLLVCYATRLHPKLKIMQKGSKSLPPMLESRRTWTKFGSEQKFSGLILLNGQWHAESVPNHLK
jgi:hypothetical protein